MTERLFVYGTLMESGIQKEVFGREIAGVPDLLYGYITGTVTFGNETYPAIRKAVSESSGGNRMVEIQGNGEESLNEAVPSGVQGIVLLVSDEDILEADFYEGEYYTRTLVTLDSGTMAYVYEITAQELM